MHVSFSLASRRAGGAWWPWDPGKDTRRRAWARWWRGVPARAACSSMGCRRHRLAALLTSAGLVALVPQEGLSASPPPLPTTLRYSL